MNMKPKSAGNTQKGENLKQIRGDGSNWILITGGVLLSMLSIRLGCKLKQACETKRDNATIKENAKFLAKRRMLASRLHSNGYFFSLDQDKYHHCVSANGDTKQVPISPVSKDEDVSLPLVKIPDSKSSKGNQGVIWTSSPDCVELPPKPFHHSNSSGSLCVSETGSDVYIRRGVMQKLCQQIKRRDDMIMEMQARIMDLQNSLSAQMRKSAHLQSQLDSANRDLIDFNSEIQRLRKFIADDCATEACNLKIPFKCTKVECGGC